MSGRKRLPAEEERRRMQLYRQGLSDRSIAENLGYSIERITSWRSNRGLPVNKHTGTAMESVLTPGQCKVMKHFIGTMKLAASKNRDFSVWEFVQAYRYFYSGQGARKTGYKRGNYANG